jgi:hypothetical protein
VTTCVRSGIGLIELLDWRPQYIATSPHHGNGTNYGIPAAGIRANQSKTDAELKEIIAKLRACEKDGSDLGLSRKDGGQDGD